MCNESNVKVISNIYPIQDSKFKDDAFIKQIRGRNLIGELFRRTDIKENKLTKEQKIERKEGAKCSKLDSEAQVWGRALDENGTISWQCRCDKVECSLFRSCRTDLSEDDIKLYISSKIYTKNKLNEESITRNNHIQNIELSKKETDNKKQNDINKDNKKKKAIEIKSMESKKTKEDIQVNENEILNKLTKNYINDIEVEMQNKFNVVSQEKIIKSNIEDKVLVDAPPGTGKTYVLIERIKYLFEEFNENEDLEDNLLILCFSKSAVNEIKDRLREYTKVNKDIEFNLDRIDIRTFDSFATWFIKEIEPETNITNCDYEDRIKLCIDLIDKNKDIFEDLNHFIVDEAQDLVGNRAELVKSILLNSSCGFTILGDRCQSIYDYQVRETNLINSKEFYKWIEEKYDDSIVKVSLINNKRQSKKLSQQLEPIRRQIIQENNEQLVDILVNTVNNIENLGDAKKVDESILEKLKYNNNIAFLCRNNSEVLKLSGFFRERDIEHTLQKPLSYKYIDKWLGCIFSGFDEEVINENDFKNLFYNRAMNVTDEDIEFKWRLLKEIEGRESSKLRVVELARGIDKNNKRIEELYSFNDDKIIISTIHKSKGREYDTVVITSDLRDLEERFNKTESEQILEEAKIYYVGLTRPKKDIFKSNIYSAKYSQTRKLENDRWIEISYRNKKKKLSYIEVGNISDIDIYSVLDKYIFKNDKDIKENQEYIINNIKQGDEVYLRQLTDGEDIKGYQIVHNDRVIGSMSNNFIYTVRAGLQFVTNNKRYGFNSIYYPRQIKKIYISDIISITKDGKFYNSILIDGLGKLEWETVY